MKPPVCVMLPEVLEVKLTEPAAVMLLFSDIPVGAVIEMLPVLEVMGEPNVVTEPVVVINTSPLEVAWIKLNDGAVLLN